MHIIWLHPTTVPVNKKYVPFQENDRFTVNRFIKKRYYYRKETQWSRHPETKWNAQKTQTERTTDRLHSTQYTRSLKKKRQRSSFRVSVAVFEWARLFKTSERRRCQYRLSEAVSKLVCQNPVRRKWVKQFQVTTVPASGFVAFTVVYQDPLLPVTGKNRLQIHSWNSNDFGKAPGCFATCV